VSRLIAIVDDDRSVLKSLQRLLAARSYSTIVFQSGLEFLASLAETTPDCLILDLHMPQMTGIEVQQRLVQSGKLIPTIIITGRDEEAMRTQCKSAGAVAYLSKPLRDASLFAAIDAAIGGAVRTP
jgi:two-component system response regulator FixJ